MTHLLSIDTTPNPNSMKLNLSASLGAGETFTRGNLDSASALVQGLLQLEGVQSLFAAERFVTLNRDPRFPWQPILDAARNLFTGTEATTNEDKVHPPASDASGQVQVWVQTFRGIPIQVKVSDGLTEERAGLSARFGETVRELQARFGADYLKERQWMDWGIRYGALADVAREMVEEIETLMDAHTLAQKKSLALGETPPPSPQGKAEEIAPQGALNGLLEHYPDWQDRFRFVQHLDASEETLPVLIQALQDEKPQIRRWAAAKLSAVKHPDAVSALCGALLEDPDVGVRRTAGDSLSDIGDPAAEPAVCQALGDKNKLVRWRAARFLAEVGTTSALPALELAKADPEYEVRLEVEAAINHIRAGSQAAGPVWKLMSQERGVQDS